MPHYILVEIPGLPHQAGDPDDLAFGIQTLLEATGVECEVHAMSSGQLYDHFNLIEHPNEGRDGGAKTESYDPSVEDDDEEDLLAP